MQNSANAKLPIVTPQQILQEAQSKGMMDEWKNKLLQECKENGLLQQYEEQVFSFLESYKPLNEKLKKEKLTEQDKKLLVEKIREELYHHQILRDLKHNVWKIIHGEETQKKGRSKISTQIEDYVFDAVDTAQQSKQPELLENLESRKKQIMEQRQSEKIRKDKQKPKFSKQVRNENEMEDESVSGSPTSQVFTEKTNYPVYIKPEDLSMVPVAKLKSGAKVVGYHSTRPLSDEKTQQGRQRIFDNLFGDDSDPETGRE